MRGVTRRFLILFSVSSVMLNSIADAEKLFGVKAIKLKSLSTGFSQTCELLGAPYLVEHKVKKGDTLSFSYAVNPAYVEDEKRFKFSILASEGKSSQTPIFTETIDFPHVRSAYGWHNHEIPLDIFAGKKIKFAFTSAMLSPSGQLEAIEPAGAYWGGVRIGNFTRRRGELNVIFISLDTLRADHLGIEGYFRDTSPNIDILGRQGVYFKEAIANGPWTLPSHRSMFTSRLPSFQKEFLLREERPIERLAPEYRMLTEHLVLAGYVTQAYTAAGYVAANFGYFRGFDRYVDRQGVRGRRMADKCAAFTEGMKWLETNQHKKFFLFLHTYEIHKPYTRTYFVGDLENPTKQELMIAKYDGGIRYADRYVGMLKKKLDDLNLTNDTIIILTSDHGEELGQRTFLYHGHSTYDEMIRVPLLFHNPRLFKPRMIDTAQVQLTDLMPTILDLVGLPIPKGVQGRSLKPLLQGKKLNEESYAYSEWMMRGPERKSVRYVGPSRKMKAILSPALIEAGLHPDATFGKNKFQLHDVSGREYYDLKADPKEVKNLSGTKDPIFSELESKLSSRYPNLSTHVENETGVDPELREQLKSLGY